MSGCSTSSAQTYENCGAPGNGLALYNALDPNAAAIKAAVASSKPPGANASYLIVAEAMLRAGGIIYYKVNPGDCPAPAVGSGVTAGQIVGLSGSAASGVVGGLGAAGVLAGPATLGISSAISIAIGGIEDLFAAHAQAVANEQSTICSVASFFNNAKRQIDLAVRQGQISSDAGAAALIQICNQAKNGLATIYKPCNAACFYQAVCQAFINFAHTWYDSIAPQGVFAQAPGGAPTTYGTPPGGVTTAPGWEAPAPPIRAQPGSTYAPAGPGLGYSLAPPLNTNQSLPGNPSAVDYLNAGYNQQTGQSAQAADVPPAAINWVAIGAVAAVILLLITLSRSGVGA